MTRRAIAALIMLLVSMAAFAGAVPRRVIIQGKVWRISEVSEVKNIPDFKTCGMAVKDQGIYLGFTWIDERRIEIRKDIPRVEKAKTVIHELMHAYNGEEFSCEKMTGHAAIFILAEAVGRIMHQNPALVKYLSMSFGPKGR